MISYLRDRQFLEFEGAPLIDSDGYFVIRSDREEWTAWLEHYRTQCSETILTSTQKRGFLLTRTRWPAGNTQASGSQRHETATPSGNPKSRLDKGDGIQGQRASFSNHLTKNRPAVRVTAVDDTTRSQAS